MRIQRVNNPEYRIVKDNGSPLSTSEKHYIEGVMQAFMNAKVLGDNSPVTKHAALRMALVAIEYRQGTCCSDCAFGKRSIYGGDPIQLHPQTTCPMHW